MVYLGSGNILQRSKAFALQIVCLDCPVEQLLDDPHALVDTAEYSSRLTRPCGQQRAAEFDHSGEDPTRADQAG